MNWRQDPSWSWGGELLTDHIREVEERRIGEAHNEAGGMHQGEKGTKTDEMLPQDAEGDVFRDKGNSDAWDQSNQVGGKDGRYSAIVVAENGSFYTW